MFNFNKIPTKSTEATSSEDLSFLDEYSGENKELDLDKQDLDLIEEPTSEDLEILEAEIASNEECSDIDFDLITSCENEKLENSFVGEKIA